MKILPNLILVQGRDWHLRVTVTTPDGLPFDLTAATVEWQLGPRWGAAALLSRTTASGIAFPDAAGGVFEVWCARADTAGIARGKYVHEAAVLSAAGFKKTVLRGPVEILPRLVS